LKDAVTAGTPLKDLAAALHLNGPSMITRFIRLLELPQGVLHQVDWGQTDATISFTAASELSRLKSHEEQAGLCTAALESELTTSEVKAIVQLRKRSRKPVAECIREILNLRPEVIRRHVFIGAIASPELSERLRQLHQVDRDRLFSAALELALPGGARVAGRLGHDRFTLAVENDEVAKAITGLTDGFETAIARAVGKALKTQPVP
jgi:hypothetical protein